MISSNSQKETSDERRSVFNECIYENYEIRKPLLLKENKIEDERSIEYKIRQVLSSLQKTNNKSYSKTQATLFIVHGMAILFSLVGPIFLISGLIIPQVS